MRNKYLWLSLFGVIFGSFELMAQPLVKQAGISVTDVSFRTASSVIIQSIVISPTSPGRAVVRFDGTCIADATDRIILAASNTTDWLPDDGNVGIQVASTAAGRRSFSHTRVYDVPAGNDTFYAVGQNYVDVGGSGIASVYGSLTVEFFPSGGTAFVADSNFNFSGDVQTATGIFQTLPVASTPIGKAYVHMDGQLYSDSADRIMLSANYQPQWLVDDGSVAAMAATSTKHYSPFSHSRMYDVTGDPATYYAVGKNVVDVGGSGYVGVHGNLSAEFFPGAGNFIVETAEIRTGFNNLRGQATALDSLTISPTVTGNVLVQFDGYCTSSANDRIILAASNDHQWHINDGSIGVSALSTDNPWNVFSHSRLYPVTAGSYTFYAIAENAIDIGGNGTASVLANFTVKFYPDAPSAIATIEGDAAFQLYPNPAQDQLFIALNTGNGGNSMVEITDANGRIINVINAGAEMQVQLDVSKYAAGLYFVRTNGTVKKFVKE